MTAAHDNRPFLVRLPPDLHEAVRQAAQRDDRTMAQYIRQSLRASVEHEPPRRRPR